MNTKKTISFTNLKLKTIKENNIVRYGDNDILVQQYLSAQAKQDLIDVTLQKSIVGESFHPLLIEIYKKINIIYLYTNISFTPKQREDELKLYDILYINGLIDIILAAIPITELNEIDVMLNKRKEILCQSTFSVGGAIKTLVNDLPVNLQESMEILEKFDPNQFKHVIAFTEAVNGGKTIDNGQK